MRQWRSALLWAVLLTFIALTAWSTVDEGLFLKTPWSDIGLRHLGAYLAVYAVWTLALRWFRPETFVRATVAAALLYSMAYARSPLPVLAVCAIVFAAWVLGRILLRQPGTARDELVAAALGLGLVAFTVSLSVFVRVNYWWSYAAAIAIFLGARLRDAMEAARRLASLRQIGRDWHRGERLLAELFGFVLIAQLLVVLKPEVGADALGMHLVIPSQVADYGLFDFNFRHVLWAVMPMGGDWVYTPAFLLGGELGSRLMNFGALLLVAALVYCSCRTAAGRPVSLVTTGLFVSSPLVQLVTGSLFVENVWAMFLVASFVAVTQLYETGWVRFGYAAGVLFGAALSTKFGSTAYLLPFLLLLYTGSVKFHKRRMVLAAIVILFLIAAPPYINAWLKTGNPFFPFLNTVFRSPFFDTHKPLFDDRYLSGLHWNSLWEITFRTGSYLEAAKGGFGFHYLVFVALAAVAIRRRWPFAVWAAMAAAVAGFAFTFSAQSYVRYLYPCCAFATIVFAAAIESLGPALRRVTLAAAVALFAMNIWFLPASGGYQRDFCSADLWDAEDTLRYLAETAPARLLVDQLNRKAPGEAAVFIETNHFAGLKATAYTNTWHHDPFRQKLFRADSGASVLRLLNDFGIHWMILPGFESGIPVQYGVRSYMERFTRTEGRAGNFRLVRTLPKFSGGGSGIPSHGEFDDSDRAVSFSGSWHRDTQFRKAMESTLTYSEHAGDACRFRFEGSQVRYAYTKARNRGLAEIRIDGQAKGLLDLYSPATIWQEGTVFGGLGTGVHEIEIRVSGKKNPAAAGAFVDVDSFLVP